MTSFPLKIVSPDGVDYDGMAEQLTVRTTTGDIGILAGHVNCVAPLGMGRATVVADGQRRYGACIGGMVSVVDGNVTLVATTFEWADQINLARAEESIQETQETLHRKDLSQRELKLAEAKLRRALVRKSVATGNK